MEEKKFRKEEECEMLFRKIGKVYNTNTPENHPIVFSNDDDFKAGMSILAISAKVFADIRIYAFQLMNNHIHLVVGGKQQRIEEFFAYYVDRLDKYFEKLDKHFEKKRDLSNFKLSLFPVNDLAYLRNAIVYVNRNGFVVNNDVTPFTYPWGSSSYFFQPIAKKYYDLVGSTIGCAPLRKIMHTRSCDKHQRLRVVDGYISPFDFCEITTAEKFYRDARQYFYLISRKVEAYSDIAKSIGEAIFYNDNDLYTAAQKIAKDQYGSHDLRTLPSGAKVEMARRLHYDYNATPKQLHRLLNIDVDLLASIL